MKITDVKSFVTAPEGINLVVVKVSTDQDGLTGYGCATFTQRSLSVAHVVDTYLAPLLKGRDPQNIEDLWNLANVNSYWRNGPVLNNALSGVDMALWDIKGKICGQPLYQLFGGKCRDCVPAYVHANGSNIDEVLASARSILDEGYRYVRCQYNGYGGDGQDYGPERTDGNYYDPKAYMRQAVQMFEILRRELGWEVGLLHDIHERLYPIDAVNLAKELERFKLFYLEDALQPDQTEWFRLIRQQCSTPIAMGELFNNPSEWVRLMSERLIDFIRIHISQIGGITPARKVIALAGAFGVRTAWHGPGDVSPFGHAANLHLDLSTPNFGIQEWWRYSAPVYEVFDGIPQAKDGCLHPNDRPGLGVTFHEEKAKKYPHVEEVILWTQTRHPDGSMFTP